MTESKKVKYNTIKVLYYFAEKFQQTYGAPFELNKGRDLKLIKRIKTLFEENENLGPLFPFLDFVFEQNRGNTMTTPFLLKIVNTKLGYVNGQKKEKEVKKVSGNEDWVKKAKRKWDKEFNEG